MENLQCDPDVLSVKASMKPKNSIWKWYEQTGALTVKCLLLESGAHFGAHLVQEWSQLVVIEMVVDIDERSMNSG